MSELPPGPVPIEMCPMCRGPVTHMQAQMTRLTDEGGLGAESGTTTVPAQAEWTMHPCRCHIDPALWEPHGESVGGGWYREWRPRTDAAHA